MPSKKLKKLALTTTGKGAGFVEAKGEPIPSGKVEK